MEKCAGCHWHCSGIRKCKSIHPTNGYIDSNLLESGLYSMPGDFPTMSCNAINLDASQSAVA